MKLLRAGSIVTSAAHPLFWQSVHVRRRRDRGRPDYVRLLGRQRQQHARRRPRPGVRGRRCDRLRDRDDPRDPDPDSIGLTKCGPFTKALPTEHAAHGIEDSRHPRRLCSGARADDRPFRSEQCDPLGVRRHRTRRATPPKSSSGAEINFQVSGTPPQVTRTLCRLGASTDEAAHRLTANATRAITPTADSRSSRS